MTKHGIQPRYRMKRHAVTQPLNEPYRFIPLTQGQNAIVDADDFDWLNRWNWRAMWDPRRRSFVAGREYPKNATTYMHRLILKCSPSEEVDHINHNSLDNRRSNLRNCTSAENMLNRQKQKRNTSGFKGVYWHKGSKRWHASIRFRNKLRFIGNFSDRLEAALAYDTKAKELHGEFAHLNFPPMANENRNP